MLTLTHLPTAPCFKIVADWAALCCRPPRPSVRSAMVRIGSAGRSRLTAMAIFAIFAAVASYARGQTTTSTASASCGEALTAVLGAGERSAWTFTTATNLASVRFATCATNVDTKLEVNGLEYDDNGGISTICGVYNENVTVQSVAAGSDIVVRVWFFAPGNTGTVRLNVDCETASPTASPTTSAPTATGHIAPTASPSPSSPPLRISAGGDHCHAV